MVVFKASTLVEQSVANRSGISIQDTEARLNEVCHGPQVCECPAHNIIN